MNITVIWRRSTPADAAGLMRASIDHDGPVVFLEHKLLSRQWRDAMAGDRRDAEGIGGVRGHGPEREADGAEVDHGKGQRSPSERGSIGLRWPFP